MADEKSVMQNIDKVSYGVCGVVGIGVLVLAFISGGGVTKANSDAKELLEDVEANESENMPEGPASVERLRPLLEEQWRVPQSNANAEWLTERSPVLVRKTKKVELAPAKHAPGHISEIALQRDAQKKRPYLKISGVMGAGNDGVEIERVVLYRKVNDKTALPVPQFSATGDFEYKDYNIEPASQYTYHFVTFAKGVESRSLAETEQKSPELGPTLPVPFDFNLNILFINSNADGSPELRAKKAFYDYESASIVQDKKAKTYTEGAILDEAKRYTIRSITGKGRTSQVMVRDNVLRKNIPITTRSKRSVESWEPMVGEPAAEESGDDDDDDDSASAPETGTADAGTTTESTESTESTTPKKSGRSGRRTFK